jgi:hypothetical protein
MAKSDKKALYVEVTQLVEPKIFHKLAQSYR